MIVVADAGPLHYLVLIASADILSDLYGRVLVPQTVMAELHAVNTPAAVRAWIAEPPQWCEISPDPPSAPSLRFLDPGERAAISLALSVRAERLLIDEWDGRAEAERRGLLVTGTLGVLAEGHRAGLIDFEESLERLRRTNFYMSPALVDRVRRKLSVRAGEV